MKVWTSLSVAVLLLMGACHGHKEQAEEVNEYRANESKALNNTVTNNTDYVQNNEITPVTSEENPKVDDNEIDNRTREYQIVDSEEYEQCINKARYDLALLLSCTEEQNSQLKQNIKIKIQQLGQEQYPSSWMPNELNRIKQKCQQGLDHGFHSKEKDLTLAVCTYGELNAIYKSLP